jgi:hypothetical protein
MSVAIVVPVYREELLPDEQVALRHLHRYLGGFPCCQVSPKSLGLRLEGFQVRTFDNHFFTSVAAYSRLMLSKTFYESFSNYEHILTYQLDCLVFSNQLEHWCRAGFDYIGAPLFKVKGEPGSGFSGACNGGLSLRNTNSFLKVLTTSKYVQEPASLLKDILHEPFGEVRQLPWIKRLKKRIQVAREVRRGVDEYMANYSLNEDHFWSGRASYFYPEFKVAPPEAALGFAFEAAPRCCFERNGKNLPFGAHAWQKWDRSFWEQLLLQ